MTPLEKKLTKKVDELELAVNNLTAKNLELEIQRGDAQRDNQRLKDVRKKDIEDLEDERIRNKHLREVAKDVSYLCYAIAGVTAIALLAWIFH